MASPVQHHQPSYQAWSNKCPEKWSNKSPVDHMWLRALVAGGLLGAGQCSLPEVWNDWGLYGLLTWVGLVVWWAGCFCPVVFCSGAFPPKAFSHGVFSAPDNLVKRLVMPTMVMTGFAHLIATVWLWQLHPLTWAGVSSIGGLALAGCAWLVWAGLFALLWGAFAWGSAWCAWQLVGSDDGHSSRLMAFIVKAIVIGVLAALYPWWVTALSSVTDMYVHWLDIAVAFVNWPTVNWLLPVVGRQGLIAVVMGLASLTGLLAYSVTTRVKRNAWLLLVLMVMAMPAITGGLKLGQYLSDDMGNGKAQHGLPPIAIVQQNLSIGAIRNPVAGDQVNPYLNHLKQAEYPAGTWVLLPEEGAVKGWITIDQPETYRERFASNADGGQLLELASTRGWTMVTGVTTVDTPTQDYFNTLWIIPHEAASDTAAGQPLLYHKQHLVPYGETLPNGLRLLDDTPVDGWLAWLLGKVGFSYIPGFSSGSERVKQQQHWPGEYQYLYPTICFEGVLAKEQFSSNGRDKQGHGWAINVSNLGWFHGSPLLARQFWQRCRLLALELSQPVVVAANTGPSGIIGGDGNPIATLPINQPADVFVP